MESIQLTDSAGRTGFFNQTVLINLRYWQTWLTQHQDNVPALDQAHPKIARAISFALNVDRSTMGHTWPRVMDLVNTFSPFMERRGYWETWRTILVRVIKVAQRTGQTTDEVTLSLLLARLSFLQSRFKEVVASYRHTIRLARQIGDEYNGARACTNLGYYFIERGQWQRAEILCCYALNTFEKLDSNHGRAHTENHLGILYRVRHQWTKSAKHFERACHLWEEMGDEHGLMRGYLNLSALYLNQKQPDTALINLERALPYALSTGDEKNMGIIYTNMGIAFRQKNNLTEAEAWTTRAETIFRNLSANSELARAWSGLGLIFSKQGDLQKARLYLNNALRVWRMLNNSFEEFDALLDIAEIELADKRWRAAKRHLEAAEDLIKVSDHRNKYRHLRPRLAKVRRRLTQTLSYESA